LENLVSNACKYSRRGVCIHIGQTQIGDDHVFFVQDDGVGFDMRYHEKLFRPFERLHLDEEYEGTGIGLANVKRIVGRHGGRIWAQSAPGKGATFFFTLAASSERPPLAMENSAFGLR
jgi:light-regulated signal transduction histidine kinase (bacteriophytochrome)